jgi:hypothetical protein
MAETVVFRQVIWLVMLESIKDRILGVDTPGQHVPYLFGMERLGY